MQELYRSTDSVMTGYGPGHMRQAISILDEMLDYSSRKPINLPDDLLLSLLEVIELCAESYVGVIADKELLLKEVALEENRRNGRQDTSSPIATAYGDEAVHVSGSVVDFDELKAFIKSSTFWNDLIVLQSEKVTLQTCEDPLLTMNKAILNSASEQVQVVQECIDYSFLLDVFDEFDDIFEMLSSEEHEAPMEMAVVSNDCAAVSMQSTLINPIQEEVHPCSTPGRGGFYEPMMDALVRDLEIISMKTQKEVPYDESGSLTENNPVGKIIIDLETLSRRGPVAATVTPVFLMCGMCIALVGRMSASSFASHPLLVPMLWSAAFIINVIAVSVPGRLDRMYSDGSHIKPWQSLFEPSPWAFAIWGVIYLTELLVTMYLCVFYKSVSSEFGTHGFQSALPYWTAGNCLQALWCFVFRPEFKSRLWIPSCCLFLSSLSLLGAYNQFYLAHPCPSSAGSDKELWSSSAFQAASNSWALVVARSIIAVHSTWMMGAALINLNSWIALSSDQRFSRRTHIAIAFMSAWFIATVGMLLSMYSSDISFALTCAWTLDALASRSMDKLKLMNKSHSNIDRSRCSSTPEVLETLSIIESILSGIVKCVALGVVLFSFGAGDLTFNYID